ncbi:MAG TPA: helix-turn-helix domain-containing protein [Acidimicrobiales bacterium]|nr:helix-turn-helix domain-containing protein [Acidimicrobiales bacterium]
MTTTASTGPGAGHQPPLSIAEAAAFLNVTDRWVRRAVYERRLPYHKVGANVRLLVEDLRAYLASTRVEPAAPGPVLPGPGLYGRPGLYPRPSRPPGGTRRPGDRKARRPGEPPSRRPAV